jgi:hypothetical protein
MVFRPSFAGAAKQFVLVGGLYFVLAVALSVSLSLWVFRPVFALLAFVVIVAAMTWAFARTFRGTTVTVTGTTVTLHSIWGQPDRVLNRSEITRMMRFDRLKGSLPMSVLLVVDRDRRRLGGAGWLWSDELMGQLMAALADERVRPEHYKSVSSFELIRDFGVDPAIRRRPVRSALVMLIAVAAGILIAWPLIRP